MGQSDKMRQGHKARLHHIGNGRYSVLFEGKLLVERSRDPECDAARVLLARGYTGTLHMLDGKTGEPRTIIDIEKAAKLRLPFSLQYRGSPVLPSSMCSVPVWPRASRTLAASHSGSRERSTSSFPSNRTE